MTTTSNQPASHIPESFNDLLARYESAMADGSDRAVNAVLQQLEQRAAQAIHSGNVPEITRLRSQVRQLERHAANAEETEQLKGALLTFTVVDRMLAAGRTAAELREERDQREQGSMVLRDRVLAELKRGAQRPADLARTLETGAPQISRVLRALVEEGTVAVRPPVVGTSDRRARWYQEVSEGRSGRGVAESLGVGGRAAA